MGAADDVARRLQAGSSQRHVHPKHAGHAELPSRQYLLGAEPFFADTAPTEDSRRFAMLQKVLAINDGTIGRVFRVLIGVGLTSLVFVGPRSLWGLGGVVLILSGVSGFCPLCLILGASSCPAKVRR